MDDLELSFPQSMVNLRDPLEPWVGMHPHWLDWSAHVKASSYYQKTHMARSVMSAGLVLKSRNDGEAMLQAHHASSEWPALAKSNFAANTADHSQIRNVTIILSSWGLGTIS